jgi:hypothetical protein
MSFPSAMRTSSSFGNPDSSFWAMIDGPTFTMNWLRGPGRMSTSRPRSFLILAARLAARGS